MRVNVSLKEGFTEGMSSVGGEGNKAEKENRKADGQSMSIYAGNLNFGEDKVAMEKKKARAMAMSLLKDAFASDDSMQQTIAQHNQRVLDLKDENTEISKSLDQIEEQRQSLKEGYGVEDDSEQAQELELLRKEKEAMSNPGVELTEEEQEQLASIKQRGLSAYQQEMLRLDDYASGLQRKADENTNAIEEENKIVSGLRRESEKQHDMVDAVKQGDDIMEAANKTIIGMLTEEVKDNIDETAEETKEATEEEKKEKEELEERIESIREKKAERSEDDMDEMYELDSVMKDVKASNQEEGLSDMKKSLEQVVGELKLTIEDTKGLVVDQET